MEEIKFNYTDLSQQLDDFHHSSKDMLSYTNEVSVESAGDLPVFEKYITLYGQILEIAELYSQLIQKSVSDISNVQQVIVDFDRKIINTVPMADTPTQKQ